MSAPGLAKIRKAVAAFVGAVVASAGGIATTDHFQLGQLTTAQVSTVLLLALSAAVATFRIPNALQPIVGAAEKAVADSAAAVVVERVVPSLEKLIGPALVQLEADLSAASVVDDTVSVPTDTATVS